MTEELTERRTPPDIVLATLLGDGAEHAEIGLFIYDDDGRYVAVNRYGADLLGCAESAEWQLHLLQSGDERSQRYNAE